MGRAATGREGAEAARRCPGQRMSLDKLKLELERALEKLGSPPEGDGSPRGSDGEDEAARRRSASSSASRRTSHALELPKRVLGLHGIGNGRGGGSSCGTDLRVDGLEPSCRDHEDGELLSAGGASSTLSPPFSPRASTQSEASDLPSCTSVGGWPATPPPSHGSVTPCSDGGIGQDPLSARSVASNRSGSTHRSGSTLAHCSTWSSLAGSSSDCGPPVGSPSGEAAGEPSIEGKAKFGWALGASLGPCRGDLLPGAPRRALPALPPPASGAGEVEVSSRVRRRTVLADLVGCLYRIDENDALACRSHMSPLRERS